MKKDRKDFRYIISLLECNDLRKNKVTVKDLLIMKKSILESKKYEGCKTIGHNFSNWTRMTWNNKTDSFYKYITISDKYDCYLRKCSRCGYEEVTSKKPHKLIKTME